MKYGIAGSLLLLMAIALGSVARAEPTRTCAYDPESGLPNPLGMRAYITVTEADGNTTFLFEQFPSNVGIDPSVPVTIASSRELTFYETPLDRARTLMLENPDYYSELVGYSDPEGFGPVNQTLAC